MLFLQNCLVHPLTSRREVSLLLCDTTLTNKRCLLHKCAEVRRAKLRWSLRNTVIRGRCFVVIIILNTLIKVLVKLP